MRVSDYRRKKLELYGTHELFRPDHAANSALRSLATRDAMHDCAAWLASGNTVAVSIRELKKKMSKIISKPARGPLCFHSQIHNKKQNQFLFYFSIFFFFF